MLVLSRRENESIQIGDDIKIVLLSAKPAEARIGIDAPRSLAIVRSELLDGLPPSKKHDFGPLSYISFLLWRRENPDGNWEVASDETKKYYRGLAESRVEKWRRSVE